MLGYANSGKTSLCEMICCNGFNKVYTHSKSQRILSDVDAGDEQSSGSGEEFGVAENCSIKNDGVPMWSEKSWECSPERERSGSATVLTRVQNLVLVPRGTG